MLVLITNLQSGFTTAVGSASLNSEMSGRETNCIPTFSSSHLAIRRLLRFGRFGVRILPPWRCSQLRTSLRKQIPC